MSDPCPNFTDAQVGLVIRLMDADKADLVQVIQECGLAMPGSSLKSTLVAWILRNRHLEKTCRALCQRDLARHVWFGWEQPKETPSE